MKRRWKGKFIKGGKCARLETLSKRSSSICELSENNEIPTENDPRDDAESGWGTGRRIVELKFLADQLKSCKNCCKPLHLFNINREQRVGYASILYISCDCGFMNNISTGKSHRPPDKAKRGMPVYDINTKAVLGVIHSGLTYRQINSLMATIEVKGLHHTAMTRREAEIHPHIQDIANESCSNVLQEEVESYSPTASTSSDKETELNDNEGIFKYDMGWQKRGSGRAYDSKSGVGTLIGNNTGRICAFGVRQSDCRICNHVTVNKENIPPHKCTKNWSGSAKAMEPDVGINLIKSVESQGVKVSTLIMDDDTTTMARIRKDLDHTVTKWSDVNHTSKHLTNSLFMLQKKHKALTNSVIAYLKKCFNYALAQTKGDHQLCKSQIDQIVPHSFGEHSMCGEWCGFIRDPDNYKHNSLSKDLSGEGLRKDLDAVFKSFSQNSEKIAPGGSTKEIESFNNMVAAKAPKRCHFSASSNLLSRVGCAVAQKNIGNGYIAKINENLGLSPGRIYLKEAAARDTERKRQRIYSNKKENKLRKLQSKFKKRLELNEKEKKEGTTYRTAVAMTHHADDYSIPTISEAPKITPLNSVENIVYFDIETGSLAKDTDILQIAACCGNETFDQYVLPRKSISPYSSRVTGLTASGSVLFLHGSPVCAIPLKEALTMFLDWIQKIGHVVLVGHNLKIFDFPRLLMALRAVNLETEFQRLCFGGIDSLHVMREIHPGMGCYKQEYLCKNLLKEDYSAHNAIDDVISLRKLFEYSKVSHEIRCKFSFTTEWGFQCLTFQDMTSANVTTMDSLSRNKVISKQMINKIASSGLQYNHLLTVYQREGRNGIIQLLSEKYCGRTRVTSCKKVFESLCDHFKTVLV